MDESLEKNNPKNPMLISPVIRCVLEFLNIEEIKNCRLVSHEWGSIGKLSLVNRARIHMYTNIRDRRAADFNSCFLNSATLFSAFRISNDTNHKNDSRMIEELNKFFENQQKSIKELTLQLEPSFSREQGKNIDITSWISKSPMVQQDTKHMTKLSIEGDIKNLLILPFHLITEIKDLALSECRINLEAGIKIYPTTLKLKNVTFNQDGHNLDRIRINDIVDFCKAEEVSLYCVNLNATQCIVDLRGNTTLQKLVLEDCEILNGETSKWVIEHLWTNSTIPYSLNSEMKIKELYLSQCDPLDLVTLPNSIQKLAFRVYGEEAATLSCSQPIVLQNLEYLHISFGDQRTDLSHFRNCPRLTHLKMFRCIYKELKSHWMPQNLKTLTLEDSAVHWADEICLNLEKLVVCCRHPTARAEKFLKAEILVEDLVLHHSKITLDKHLTDFLEYPNLLNYGKRLYIGKLDWEEKKSENTVLTDYVDVKSSFYVFKNGEKGRAVSEKGFYEFIPKHMDGELYTS